jgi:hypothetical protein
MAVAQLVRGETTIRPPIFFFIIIKASPTFLNLILFLNTTSHINSNRVTTNSEP